MFSNQNRKEVKPMLALIATAAMLTTPARPTVLIVTHTTGYRHSCIEMSTEILTRILKDEMDVETAKNGEEVKAKLSPEALKKYSAVIFNSTTGDIGIPDMTAFLNWVKEGHGFVGIHSAANTCQPEQMKGDASFMDMLGLNFKGHGNQCEVVLKLEHPENPAIKPLGGAWKVKDEIYLFHPHRDGSIRNRGTVLLSLDTHPPDGAPGAGQPEDVPLAWVRPYGKGKVFYTALGHREDLWESEKFQAHVKGGILQVVNIQQ